MKKSRCLGLVGGLGVGATIHYYQALAKAHQELGCAMDVVITHAEIPQVREYVEANDRSGLAEYLVALIRRMQAAGAEIAAIPAVTPHLCIRELVAASPLPIVNIFEPLIREVKARAARRVAVFGTRFVMESRLYGFVPELEIVQARPDEVDYIHQAYMEMAQQGKGTEEQHRNLTALAHTLRQREGIDLIVLAGTDLALVFNPANTDFPYIDCAALHIAAILNEVTGQSA